MPILTTAETLRRASDLHRQGDLGGARRLYGEVLAREPNNAEALHLAGAAAAHHGNAVEAVNLLTHAARLDPRNPYIHFNLAATLAALGRSAAALVAIDAAAGLGIALPQAHCLRGNLLAMQDRMEEALRAFEEALAIEPSSSEAHGQRGTALMVLQRHAEALAALDRAVELAPRSAKAHFTRAVLLLTLGDYEQGFREHEWRWQSGTTSSSLERRAFAQPPWLGEESLAGRRILLYSEQGLGDTLQFCRYASLVADRGATVLLQVQRPLVALLRSLRGVTEVVGKDDPLPPFDCHCPLMSLPLALGTRLETVPAPSSYLKADPERVALWRQRLGERRAPRVGLMWNGNPDNPAERFRSFPLAAWVPHLPPGFEYHSLQRFVREADRAALRGSVVRDLAAEQTDFGDAAALCACMDVVISVCTSIAHVSGALGRPTWVMLSRFADWRWLLDREDSPWYPTARLYRQRARSDWTHVFDRVAGDLAREIG